MSRTTGPSKQTVELVWERDGGSCARCGRSLRFEDRGYTWSISHRVGRGMGGTRNDWVNLPGALNLLCGSGVTGCHGHIETHREEAYAAGWLVRRHGTVKPSQIAVQHALHGLVYLTDDGGTQFDPPVGD